MADHTVVERRESGVGMGVVLGILVVLLVAVIALFFAFGGPTRFMGSAPSQTNVNVPAQQQAPAQQQPQSGPNFQIPRQVDVNINQPPAQQAPVVPPPVLQGPSGGS
jgi:flagellar basal body-associated protein FliL